MFFFSWNNLNPFALRKAKIVYNFGLSECNRVKALDPAYKTYLDLPDCFGRGKPLHIIEEIWYSICVGHCYLCFMVQWFYLIPLPCTLHTIIKKCALCCGKWLSLTVKILGVMVTHAIATRRQLWLVFHSSAFYADLIIYTHGHRLSSNCF